ncbi:lysozyme [Roseibium album]|uniref:lysozyme n=1 Tax=Roseibium album TaxID=311410 RepID=UPI002492992B|nr:lysozyme [Roseibium album]
MTAQTSQISYDLRLLPWTGGNEGFVARWYKDPTGTPTIGYGFTWASPVFRSWWMTKHNSKMRPGDTISKSDAIKVLRLLIEEDYAPPVFAKLKSSSSQITLHAAAASIDMTYNCGARALTWSWFKSLLAGKVRDAAARYRKTATTSKGRRLPGLVRRRKEGAAILEHNSWPAWVKSPKTSNATHVAEALPNWRLQSDDFWQGIRWLEQLKLLKPTDRKDVDRLRSGILAFQTQHPQLANDGILGRATLDQIQRVVDLKTKASHSTAAGAAGSGAGMVETGTVSTGYGDIVIVGSLLISAIVLGYFAWTYRDEVKLALKTIGRKL